MNSSKSEMKHPSAWILWLTIGSVLMLLPGIFPKSDVAFTISSLSGPFFFLTAIRRSESVRQVRLTGLAFGTCLALMRSGIYGPKFFLPLFVLHLLLAPIYFMPFFLDYIVRKKYRGILSTLVFPLSMALFQIAVNAMDLSNHLDPANAFYTIPLLSQGASIIGEYGLCFVFMWVSVLLSDVVTEKGRVRVLAAVLAGILVIADFGYGFFRLKTVGEKALSEADTIRVACVTGPEDDFLGGYEHTSEEYAESLRHGMEEAAKGGADMVLFNEEFFCCTTEEEATYVELACELAKTYEVPVIFPADIRSTTRKGKAKNSFRFIDKEGNVQFECIKNNLVPFIESFSYVNGEEKIHSVECELNGKTYRLAFSICYDANDSFFIRKMPKDTDIFIAPSWDWEPLCYKQPFFTGLRTVENGVTMIKPTFEGLTYSCDAYGRETNRVSTIGRYNAVDIITVPVTSCVTLYNSGKE